MALCIMEISQAAYKEIKEKLIKAGYQHRVQSVGVVTEVLVMENLELSPDFSTEEFWTEEERKERHNGHV